MKIIDLVRLIKKHLVLLIITPIILAGLVTYLTKNPDFKYASETTLYTGIASGSSVEMDKSFSYFANNTAFDNLINVIRSRETHQEVAIRLLSQHLLMGNSNPKFISGKSMAELNRITPEDIKQMVHQIQNSTTIKPALSASDSTARANSFSFTDINEQDNDGELPAEISKDVYEQTVKVLTEMMMSSDTNFVYRLLNFNHPHYSISAISSISVQRISNSDLVRVKYTNDDPGICQQTLLMLTEVCIRNYKSIKENRSDAVVKYFEFQLSQAANRLKIAEDKLLEFNKVNNIINYYEQSKAVAVVKEDLDVEYNNKRIQLAGIQAAIQNLEEKLSTQDLIQIKNSNMLDARNKLGKINYQISSAETLNLTGEENLDNLADLKLQAEKLKEEIKTSVAELYSYRNSVNGLPVSTILNDWISNIIEEEYLKAGIEVLGERIKEFQKQYAIYAPAGANIKRIEREISVSEQEFLEILHGLNLAKLKLQDNELSSNIKPVDRPFYPISPIPTKRKIIILAAGMLGFIIVLFVIFILEYFDDTLKKQTKASKILKLPYLGIFPRILLNAKKINLPFINNRLLEIIIQNIELSFKEKEPDKTTHTILFFSTQNKEGKTTIMGNIARKLKMQGKKVLLLNYTHESLYNINTLQPGYSGMSVPGADEKTPVKNKPLPILSLLLGYPDLRIDYKNLFLDKPENYLDGDEYNYYKVDEKFYALKNYHEILTQNNIEISFEPDIVLIEIPPILYYPYPVELISGADLPLLICRSNRFWTEADQSILDNVIELNNNKTQFILNGVDIQVVESMLGEVPRKRSWIRRKIKNVVQLQFFTKSQI